jgi:hypothetical protein
MKGRKLIEHELTQRRERLFSGKQPALLAALRQRIPTLRDAIVINHIPEQFEDIYAVLVDPDHVAIVEIAREPERSVRDFELRSASEYVGDLSSRDKRQFQIAQEMIARGGA